MAPPQNLKVLSTCGVLVHHPAPANQPVSNSTVCSVNPHQRSELWLCVYLCQLPLDVLRDDTDQPAVVTEGRAGRVMVSIADPLASKSGIQSGMTLAMALSLNQHICIYTRNPHAERCGLEGLATRLVKISSRVALYVDNSIVVEVQRSLRLFGGIEGLLQCLKHDLDGVGYTYTLGLAPTPRAAFWLAQSPGENMVCAEDSLVSALGGFPIQLVAQNSKQCVRMQRSSIRTLADLMRLPRDGLARRFGTATLKILDQALGKVPELVDDYKPPEYFYRKHEFYLPTRDLNHIRPAVTALLEEFQSYLTQRQAATQRFQCKLVYADGTFSVVEVGCSHYANRAKHMLMLLEEHLQQLQLKTDAVSVVIQASHIEAFTAGQFDLLDPQATDQQSWCQLVEQFEARFGNGCLKRLTAYPDHRPEHAHTMSGHRVKHSAEGLSNRPLWLLEMPQALTVVQNQPQWYGVLRLARSYERIEQGWWDHRDICRDYCVARNSHGSQLWIYRDRRSKGWFLHGLFA